jgi:hypothetical protein
MTTSRVVRIPARTRSASATSANAARIDAERPVGSPVPSAHRENRFGRQRALRTFLAFVAGLVAIYAFFLGTLLTDPYVGLRNGATGYVLLSALALALALGALFVTIFRAPREIRTEGGVLVLRERYGPERRFPIAPGLLVRVVKRYPEGLLSEEATEMVEVTLGGSTPRNYLVDAGAIPETTPR